MNPSLFNCLIIYWAKKSGGDSKSHNDEDSDGLYPADRFQGWDPVTLPCHADGVRMGCANRQDNPT